MTESLCMHHQLSGLALQTYWVIWEFINLFNHDLFENVQVSDHNVRLLSNVNPVVIGMQRC